MRIPVRLLALAAAFTVLAGSGVARAQTVMVRKAPAGATIEVVVNTTPVTSGTADAAGDATLPFSLMSVLKKQQIDANVYVDVCGAAPRRIVLVERGSAGAPVQDSCERRDIPGLFLIRRVTSLVVDVGGPIPTVLLVQGSFDLKDPNPGRARLAPTGLVLFGGGGLGVLRDAKLAACGNLNDCDTSTPLGYTFGAEFWVARFVSAEVSYLRPAKLDISGAGQGFRFDSAFDAHALTIAGKAGLPLRIVRLYGKAGLTYSDVASTTVQTIDEVTVTIDGVSQTIPGGEQSFELKTRGWSWLAGGGVEVWAKPSFAIYLEGGRAFLKGSPEDDREGETNDAFTSIMIGARFKIGG